MDCGVDEKGVHATLPYRNWLRVDAAGSQGPGTSFFSTVTRSDKKKK
jgi:hypothetical protein